MKRRGLGGDGSGVGRLAAALGVKDCGWGGEDVGLLILFCGWFEEGTGFFWERGERMD
jgi:hypothetical protein